jgi:hypothetical protein
MHMLHDFQHLGGATPSCLSFQIGDCRPPALVTSDWSSSGDRWWCNSQSYGLSVNCSENLLRCEQSGRDKEPLSWQILRRDDLCPSRHCDVYDLAEGRREPEPHLCDFLFSLWSSDGQRP